MVAVAYSVQTHFRFARLSISTYENAKSQAREFKVPLFGEHKWPVQVGELFGSNITFTYGGFSNIQHLDHDDNDYTFGIWYPIRLSGTVLFCYL